MINAIKPIETVYNGYRFRSRLEARWAVFLDALGVEYEYEPEGFELQNGMWYLPDFRVKCYGKRGEFNPSEWFYLYIEVKGRMTLEDAEKIDSFFNYPEIIDINEYPDLSKTNPVLVVDHIPDEKESPFPTWDEDNSIPPWAFNYETIDADYFPAYPSAHNGKFYLWGGDSNYIRGEDILPVRDAYKKARQARFEHGETP